MSLVKVVGNGQITLPPEVLEALRVKEGDHLEAEVVEGEVRLKPVAIVDRAAAWQRVMEIVNRDKWIGPEPRPEPEEEERQIFEAVEDFRDRHD